MSSKIAFARLLALTASAISLTGCVHRTLLNDLPEKAIPGISGISSPVQKAIAIRRAIEKGGVTAQAVVLKETEKIAVRKDTSIWLVKSNATDMLLVPVSRKLGAASVQSAVKALLEGPYDEESKQGLGSEIPRGTVLLGVDENDKQIEINLSKRFASGGGTDSIETRLEQLSKTVRPIAGEKPVYLNVENKRLTMTPGEGIEVRQPINR